MAKYLTDRDVDQSIWGLVETVNAIFEREIAAILQPLDLTTELLKVVYLIDDFDGGTIEDLVSASRLEPERVMAGVRALQMRGLVSRPKPKEDPEQTIIRFTTEGRLKARRAHAAVRRLEERAGGWLGVHREPMMAALRRLGHLPSLPPVGVE